MGNSYKDKWKKFNILKKSSYLASKLPQTNKMTEKTLWEMVDQHKQVILKPTQGKGGEGVIQVSKEDNGKYQIHTEKNIRFKSGKKKTYYYIKKMMKPAIYMVQERIPLAKVSGRPFDLRVTVQRKRKSSWRITGRLAKVAGSGYIVTNISRSKGKVIPIESAIRQSSLRGYSTSNLLSKVDSIALKAAKQLNKSFPWLCTVGMDMALDSKGKVWIIEANFTPDHTLFLRLKDRSMYHTIMSYVKK